MLLDVVSETTVPEVTLIAQVAATACGTPPPIISAASDDDASKSLDLRAMRPRIEAARADVGIKVFERGAAQALDCKDD
jgi:hypothetical protein